MAAHVIASVTVKDPVRYEDYRRAVLPTIEKYGGKFVARGGRVDVLEGEWRHNRLVIVEFPSVARARQWWESEEYAGPKALRQATAESDFGDRRRAVGARITRQTRYAMARAMANAAAAATPPINRVCQALRPAPVCDTRPFIAPKMAKAMAVTIMEISSAVVDL